MANYGVGGQYEHHFDFSSKHDEAKNTSRRHHDIMTTGDRLATMLFYLNDVEAGGRTIFPELRLSVVPVKGAALFWYNLFRSGQGDERTLHAACPVIAGTKWAANKWIHEFSNWNRRPCGLSSAD